MKKIMVICVLCLVAVFAFAACSTPTETTTAPEPTVEPTVEATVEPTVEPTVEVPEEPVVEDVTEEEPAVTDIDVNGTWLDPLTDNTLEMADGSFTLADADGNTLRDGTYEAAEVERTYNVAYSDGTTGSFTVQDTVIEFTDSDGNVVLYDSETLE